MDAKTPRGVKAWLELAKKMPLPILKASAKLLTKQIKDGASLAEMAQTIERDPALCLHLFLAANRHNKNKELEVSSLSHVVTTLGTQGLINVVKQAPQMELHKSDAYQKGYLQSQADSSLAGHLVEYWCSKMHIGNPEKLKWATIISGAPQWIMWRVGYGSMRKSQWLAQHEFHPLKKVENNVFGCQLDDVSNAVGRYLKLPLLAQQALELDECPSSRQWGKMLSPKYLDYFDNDKRLRLQKSKPITLIALVKYLSVQVNLGWMHRHCLRSQIIIAHLSNQPLDQVIKQNHHLAVEHSRNNASVQVLPAAASLLWPDQKELHRPWLRLPVSCVEHQIERGIPATKTIYNKDNANVDNIKQPPRHANKDLLMGLINQFNHQVASFNDVHEILRACNKAINEGLGMRRTFVCILDKSGKVLRPLYCVGIENDSSIRGLKIKLDSNRFFAKLLGKSSSLKVDASNYSHAKHMFDDNILNILSNQNFMAMSLFANGKAIGVIYADATVGEDCISDKEYQAFKKICQCASNALDGYAQKKRVG
jgi:hypothetical protein